MNKPLLIIGNKRSGTSFLVSLLNLHPKIFIAHEADVIWLLYQLYRQTGFKGYRWDNQAGMNDTLASCGRLLAKDKTPKENFDRVLTCLMTQGSSWTQPMPNKKVEWLGDKKPFQNMDPELVPFILENFPEVRFIHLIRHPFAMAFSASKFKKADGIEMWGKMSFEELIERWTMHEKWALELKDNSRARVITLKYEDLCRRTSAELKRLFEFLSLPVDRQMLKKAERMTNYLAKGYPEMKVSVETAEIMKSYGYKTEALNRPKLVEKLLFYLWKTRKLIFSLFV